MNKIKLTKLAEREMTEITGGQEPKTACLCHTSKPEAHVKGEAEILCEPIDG